MEKSKIVYASSNPKKMGYVFFGNYRDKSGRIYEYLDVNGMEHRGFAHTQPTLILNRNIEAHALLDNFLKNHPLVLSGKWSRTDMVEKENLETKNVLDSAHAIVEAAKMNEQDVYDFAKLSRMNINSNADVLRAKIIKIAQVDADRFMNTHFDPEKSYRIFILDAIKSKKISYKNDTFMYGKEAIGTNEEQVIVWLKENKDIYAILRQELRGGESITQERKPIEAKTKQGKSGETKSTNKKKVQQIKT